MDLYACWGEKFFKNLKEFLEQFLEQDEEVKPQPKESWGFLVWDYLFEGVWK